MGLLKWVFRLAVPLVIVAGIVFFLSQGLKDISLESFDVDGLKGANTNSATVSGTFHIDNPSDIPVPVKGITYDLILEKTEERIGGGQISTFLLDANKVNDAPFEHQLEWVPTAQMLSQIATDEKVFLIISGEIQIDIPELNTITLPFEEKTDIKEYVMKFATQNAPVPTPDTPINSPIEQVDPPSSDNPLDSITIPPLN